MACAVRQLARSANPFPRKEIARDAQGIPRYTNLPATLVEMLTHQVHRRGDAEAVAEIGGARMTYAQLWDRAARVAGGLRSLGVGRGDRVAIRYPAGVDWVLAFWGTVFAGGIAVAVNTRSAPPEVAFVLGDADVKVALAVENPLPDGEPYVIEDSRADDVAVLFYTSGTTGRPKGVPTTHEALLTNAENMTRCLGLSREQGPDLRTLICVPLFHVTACNSQLMVAAYIGGTAVIQPSLNLPVLIEALVAERISFLVSVPAVYALLLRHPGFADADVTAVRRLGYGGAPITPELVRALKAAFPHATVFNGYGMTETASLITVLPDQDAVEHADSVGYAVPSVDLGILSFDGDPDVGELVVRGANVTAGYWRRADATADTILDGWLRTGDVVRVDEAGRVHLVDRIKDIINRGGENISSVAVETVLLAAPGVNDAAVLAVPDEVMGEKVGAVLYSERPDLDIAGVIAHCRERLADFEVPQYVTVRAEPLPRNAGGKLLKGELRRQVRWGK
ncbi:class I adenylate-forming enzyme family protein [Nocardia nepalensis]|uniref:class I adenylate-forming enzyme family protein n=1 Tax=Nocardia nepalensis TaxID=3375448 RepID=UPI003B6731DC